MADLQPLGSEKLKGMEKINRILEISKFKESLPSPINETSKTEYKITLADGKEYQIVKEKSGYIIKTTLSESISEYIDPIKSRKYYQSYSQALKRLNLMAKDMNTIHNNESGTSLFSEQKKFVLKTPNVQKKNTEPESDIENVPPPPPSAPLPSSSTPPPPPGESEDLGTPPPPPGEDMPPPPPSDVEGGEDMPPPPSDVEGEDTETEDTESDDTGGVTFKTIQKLTGKLGQKLRTLESQGEEPMSSKDIKYVINSILSALNLSSLDEDDKEEIMNKFEGEEGEESEDMDNVDMEDEEMGDESNPDFSEEEPTPEGGEMGESWDDLAFDISSKRLSQGITPHNFKENENLDNPHHHIKRIADEMFVESKVENILANYFVISESEKRFNKEVESNRKIVKKITKKEVEKEIKRLSESIKQEINSIKFLQERDGARFVGKTNKKNLVFEINNNQYKITPQGRIL